MTNTTDKGPLTQPHGVLVRRECIRTSVIHNHLQSAVRHTPSAKIFPQSLALASALDALATSRAPRDSAGDHARTLGGISSDDLIQLSPVPLPTLSPRLCQQLERQLRQTLLSVAHYWSAGEDPDTQESEDDRVRSATDLPALIRERQDALARDRATLQECRTRVLRLIREINEAYPALEEQLIEALTVIPPQLHATRSAQADVIAATIEAALLKLSVVRARAHRALYGQALPSDPRATVARAVTAAHAKLKERQRAQDTEMRKLDRQIEEYESMLNLVDGRDGSFAQVVKDMARVKRETEECRKDLRRLGWTED
ncbi:hypothetical protein GSI_12878 [Ganoderma sinense ZZ0214-1]|uniref:Uncharacterized protein n=1 Tax=Ganoderma sinense ZZ0214-1 TaxID=1077348 RepID=A0A2G8RU03_9APHY|nr:hypothetical protein GSI_12878 [Ganoderma sinense ZZ0214-1]